MGWYFGFKLHLICNELGEILNFMLTKANVDDRDENVFNRLTDNVFGKLFADQGYTPWFIMKQNYMLTSACNSIISS